MESSEEGEHIYVETQEVINAMAQAKAVIDESEAQFQKSQAYFSEVTKKLTSMYDEEASLAPQLEYQTNRTDSLLHDNKNLREKAQNIYQVCQDTNEILAALEQQNNIIEQHLSQVDQYYTRRDIILNKCMASLKDERIKVEKKISLLKEEGNEKTKLMNELESITNEIKQDQEVMASLKDERIKVEKKISLLKEEGNEKTKLMNELESITNEIKQDQEVTDDCVDEPELTEILSSVENIEREIQEISTKQEEVENDIEKITVSKNHKIAEITEILETDECKSIYDEIEKVNRLLSGITDCFKNEQVLENELCHGIDTEQQGINELEIRLSNANKDKINVTETFTSTLKSLTTNYLLCEANITRKLEYEREQNDKNNQIIEELRSITESILSSKKELADVQTNYEEISHNLLKIQQTATEPRESTIISSEIEKLQTEVENIKNDLDMCEKEYQKNMDDFNNEILRMDEDFKLTDESTNEKLQESQKKIIDVQVLNKDTYENMTTMETKLKDMGETVTQSERSLSRNHRKMKFFDNMHQNITTEIKVIELKKSKKKTVPKIPHAHFPPLKAVAKTKKVQKTDKADKTKNLKSILDNMSDTSAEGESMTYAEYLRRRNAKSNKNTK